MSVIMEKLAQMCRKEAGVSVQGIRDSLAHSIRGIRSAGASMGASGRAIKVGIAAKKNQARGMLHQVRFRGQAATLRNPLRNVGEGIKGPQNTGEINNLLARDAHALSGAKVMRAADVTTSQLQGNTMYPRYKQELLAGAKINMKPNGLM